MTDLELTKLAAEAMGFKAVGSEIDQDGLPYTVIYVDDPYRHYDPLHDDAQAMALVKKFRLEISGVHSVWIVCKAIGDYERTDGEAVNEALNYAIVECVAKMQEAK